jgi:hypothetical protein
MTSTAQRIAIAEACGWTYTRATLLEKPLEFWTKPDAPRGYSDGSSPPDYLNDLNAMHEAERTLDYGQRSEFRAIIKNRFTPDRDRFTPQDQFEAVICHATAAQRAEAFLRTLNLWKD